MLEAQAGPNRGGLRQLFDGDATLGLPDRELLDRFLRSGDEGAFAAIVERHGALVARVCRSILRRPADIDDAFHATFLVLVRRAEVIRDGNQLGPWLYGVARRVALRAQARTRRRLDREAGASADLADLPDRPGAIDPTRRDLGLAVRVELGRLPRVEALAVALCDLDGLSHREAADRLGWPLGTVKTRVARGRDRLRVRLTRRGLAPALPWLGEALTLEATEAAAVARSLAGATARTAGSLAAGSPLPASLLAPGAGALARRWGRGLLIAPGSWAVVGLGIALAVGAVPSGWAGVGNEPMPTPQAQAPPMADAAQPRAGAERVVIETGIPQARRVEVADIDGDGKPDLVVAGEEAIRWFQNPTWVARTITGGLDPAIGRVADIAVLDADGDGKREVALAARGSFHEPHERLWLAQPGAQINDDWTFRPLPDVPGIAQVRAGDIDGDGKPELIAAFRDPGTKPGGRDPKLVGVSTLKLDLAHPQGGLLKTAQMGSWLKISALAVRPPRVPTPDLNRVMVGLSGIKVEPMVASPTSGFIEVATPNGIWLLQLTPDRVRVTVSGPDDDGPIRLIPAEPYRAFQRGRGPMPGEIFLATVPVNPHAPLSVWEPQERPELPPRVDAEQDPAGAALRVAAVFERARSSLTNFGTSTLASSPLDTTRLGGESVAVADLDGDGTDEIVAGYTGPRYAEYGESFWHHAEKPGVVVYRRQGKAWVGTDLDATIRTRDLRVVDLDGDGRPEVVALQEGPSGLVILRLANPDAVPAAPPAPPRGRS